MSTQPIYILSSVIAEFGDCVRYKMHRSSDCFQAQVTKCFAWSLGGLQHIGESVLPDRFEMTLLKKKSVTDAAPRNVIPS